jgi:hypothetical protein
MSTTQPATAVAKSNRHQRRTATRSPHFTAKRLERHERVRARAQAREPELSLADRTAADLETALPVLVPAEQAARTLGVSVRTLWSWRDRGLLRAMKIGGCRIVFPRAEIIRLVRESLEGSV